MAESRSAAPDSMTIGALAQAGGVGVETIRYCQRRGLLPEPARPHGGIRRYGAPRCPIIDAIDPGPGAGRAPGGPRT